MALRLMPLRRGWARGLAAVTLVGLASASCGPPKYTECPLAPFRDEGASCSFDNYCVYSPMVDLRRDGRNQEEPLLRWCWCEDGEIACQTISSRIPADEGPCPASVVEGQACTEPTNRECLAPVDVCACNGSRGWHCVSP